MFVGTSDHLADPKDNQWLKTQVKNLVHYKEYDMGHMTFLLAKDMSYFDTVKDILRNYNSDQQ